MVYRRFKKRGLTNNRRKRWYLNASATLPFIGKTNVSMGNKFKRSVVNVVRNRLEDPLHKIWSTSFFNSAKQDTIYSLNLTGNIPQGDTGTSRSGDNIHLEALKMSLIISKGVTAPNNPKDYRVMVIKSDQASGGGVDTWSGTIGWTDLFHGATAVPCAANIDSKKCTVIFDKMYRIKPTIASTSDQIVIKEFIPLKATHTYKSGTNYGKNCNYYLVFSGYEASGTVGVTEVAGFVSLSADLIFKDSK